MNRRIAALEEAGIIKGNVSLIDGTAEVGRPVTIVVRVVDRKRAIQFTLEEETNQRFVSCPQVQRSTT